MFEFKNLAAGVDIPNMSRFVAAGRIGQEFAIRTDGGIDDPSLRYECVGRSGMGGFQQLLAGGYIPGKGKIAGRRSQALTVAAECEIKKAASPAAIVRRELATHGIKKVRLMPSDSAAIRLPSGLKDAEAILPGKVEFGHT